MVQRIPLALATAALGAALFAPIAQADTSAGLPASHAVDTYNGQVLTVGGVGHGRFRIRLGTGKSIRRLVTKPWIFGARFGTTTGGATVVTYASCTHGEFGCSQYAYSLKTRRSAELHSGLNICFGGADPELRHGLLFLSVSGGKPMPTCADGTYMKRPGQAAVRLAPYMTTFDEGAGYLVGDAPQPQNDPGHDAPGDSHAIELVHIGHGSSIVAPSKVGISVAVPFLDGGFVYWRRTGTKTDIVRRKITGGPARALARTHRRWITKSGHPLGPFSVHHGAITYLYGPSGRHIGHVTNPHFG
jgi:hypothetical protein